MSSSNNKYIQQYKSSEVLILFEGLGGTGKAWVLYLMSYLAAALFMVKATVKYSVLDIDPDDAELLGENFHDMGKKMPPTHDLFGQLETRPKDFVGREHLGPIRHLKANAGPGHKLIHGAHNFPPLGKLIYLVTLWNDWNDFSRFVSRPYLELRSIRRRLRNGSGNGQESALAGGRNSYRGTMLNIQTTSISGGYGASQVLDQADLRHYIYQRRWGAKEYEQRVNLLCPESFDHIDNRLKAIAWATMLQIEERYSNRPLKPLRYGTVTLERQLPPWVEVTLYNRMSSEEGTYNGRSEIVQVIAEVDRLKHFGPIGEEFHRQFVNAVNCPKGFFCSAAGAFRLTIDTQGMRDLGEIWLGQALIEKYLLRTGPVEQGAQLVADEVAAFCDQQRLGELTRLFEQRVNQLPIKPTVDSFANERRQDLPNKLANHEYQLCEAARQELDDCRAEHVQDWAKALDEFIERQINGHGLRHTHRVLTQLAETLSAEQQRIKGQLNKTRSELTTWQQAVQSQTKRLWHNHRKNFLSWQQEKIRLRLREEKLVAHRGLLQAIRQMVTDRQQEIVLWLDDCEQLVEQLDQRAIQVEDERNSTRPICVINILDHFDREAEARLINQQIAAKWQRATQAVRLEYRKGQLTLRLGAEEAPGETAQSLRTEEDIEKLLAYARTFFDFGHLSVEAWLRQHDKSVEDWLADFDLFAAPLVTLDQAKHPPIKEIKILGTEKEGGYFGAANQKGWTVVATGDPHNVAVLISWQHLNWRLLTQSDSWEQAYHRESAKHSLHVLAEWHGRVNKSNQRTKARKKTNRHHKEVHDES